MLLPLFEEKIAEPVFSTCTEPKSSPKGIKMIRAAISYGLGSNFGRHVLEFGEVSMLIVAQTVFDTCAETIADALLSSIPKCYRRCMYFYFCTPKNAKIAVTQ